MTYNAISIKKKPEADQEEIHQNKGTRQKQTMPDKMWHEQKHFNKERKKNQSGINNPPEVPISHPTYHNNKCQNGPNMGSKGEECMVRKQERSQVETEEATEIVTEQIKEK
eukprot:9216115-Ditylum_brightwellii.AAC.1